MDIKDVEKLNIGPKDILIIRTNSFPSVEELEKIKGMMPYNNPVIFLPEDAQMSVIKAEDDG